MNKILCAVILFSAIGVTSCSTTKPINTNSETPKIVDVEVVPSNLMQNGSDSFSYAAGLNIARSMQQQGVPNVNGNLVQMAINDVLNNRTLLLTDEQASMTLQEQLQAFAEKKAGAAKEVGRTFMAENKTKPGVMTTASGLQYEIITAGVAGGLMPKAIDTVVVHYVGTTLDGAEFDSSVKRGEPASFPLNRVISGWTEILQLMTKGAKWKVVIPSELAYGEQGAGGAIPPHATLIFEIELLDILPAS